jgi:hypothetical protein
VSQQADIKKTGVDAMKLHIVLAALVALALFASQTDAQARGGGGGGFGGHGGGFGGRGGGFGGRGQFYGHNGYGYYGHGYYGRGYYGHGYYGHGYYNHGRYYYGGGWGFYGYPWWPWWWGWGAYYPPGPYYGYDYGYDGGYYGSSDPAGNSGNYSSQFNSTRAVQAALAWRGFYNGRIDGAMGPETRSAIEAFQKQQGLPVTGEIDSNLTKALQRNR